MKFTEIVIDKEQLTNIINNHCICMGSNKYPCDACVIRHEIMQNVYIKGQSMKQHHYLKCETNNYQAIERGEKRFESRLNDRNYKVGDMVYLKEICLSKVGDIINTGRELPGKEIKYIMYGPQFGIAVRWCVFNW